MPAGNPETPGPLTVEELDNGQIWRIRLGGSKGNVIDARLMAALGDVVARAGAAPALRALVLEGEGKHFSFGASVQEHLPEQVEGMLSRFHALARAVVDCGVPLLAAVRGQCLGGGLEVVLLAHRVFAAPDARLGQPEITLGVFAPLASLLLPERVGRPAAEDLLLSGRSVTAEEALAIGLVDGLADDPAQAALDWARQHLLKHSASSLRYAVRAARASLSARLRDELPAMEKLYLGGLMSTHDAIEGLDAFVEKRPPVWSCS
jgi:cyclohexa-1,5-dienecarbonyl-CoA hydratase